jgi:hypothetical protein
MRPFHRIGIVAGALAIAAALAAACGQWQQPALTGPSLLPGPAAIPSVPAGGSATISGTVNGASRARSWNGYGSSSTEIKVTVEGTNTSTTVDFFGRFVLEGVPVGSIRLHFSGPGVDATLNVGVVRERERIDFELTVKTTVVTVESQVRIEEDDSVEIEGPVTSVAGTCPNLTVSVQGWTVNLSTSTQASCNSVKVGVRIKVTGSQTSTKVVVVVRVVVVAPSPPKNPKDDDDDDDGD